MEDYIKTKLKAVKFVKTGRTGGGCISDGTAYETDNGLVFVKKNSKSKADIMFEGESEGLKEILKTNTVKVPVPLLTGKVKNNSFLVLEYLKMNSLDKFSCELGTSLANLHLHNLNLIKQKEIRENFVGDDMVCIDKFGFHATTCCGYLPQDNEWCQDWVMFYTNQRLKTQIDMVVKEKGDREVIELWSKLQLKIPQFFNKLEIKPSLLHGDLWSGNAGETEDGPVVFDAAAYFGHHEFDLAIAGMFGGFSREFYKSYHKVVPKEDGFAARDDLYLLFHHLNHWNHFGAQYKHSTLSLMRNLVK